MGGAALMKIHSHGWMYAKLEVGKARYFWARSGKSWKWDGLEVGQA